MSKEETLIQNAIRVALSELGIVRRNNTGVFLTSYGTPITIGIPGESDLALFAQGGKTYFIEIKTASGRQSQKQKNFEKRVRELGFTYIIMRSPDDAREFIKAVKSEQRVHKIKP